MTESRNTTRELNNKIQTIKKKEFEILDSMIKKMLDLNKEIVEMYVELITGQVVEVVCIKLDLKLRRLQLHRCIRTSLCGFWIHKNFRWLLKDCRDCYQYFLFD